MVTDDHPDTEETVATVATPATEPEPPTRGSRAEERSSERSGLSLSDPVARALHSEEVERARGWALVVVLLASSALAFLPLLPGTVAMKTIFSFAVFVTLSGQDGTRREPIVNICTLRK